MIGFEVLLLTYTLVILESTMYVVVTGSPSVAREGGGMTCVLPTGPTGITVSAGFHLVISPEAQTALATGHCQLPPDSSWGQTAPPNGSTVNRQLWQHAPLRQCCQLPVPQYGSAGNMQHWQQGAWQKVVRATCSTGSAKHPI